MSEEQQKKPSSGHSHDRVVIYSKPDCCLCDELKHELFRLQTRRAFTIAEINILEDPRAFAEFSEEIPVVFVNGKFACRYHLDEAKFLSLLD